MLLGSQRLPSIYHRLGQIPACGTKTAAIAGSSAPHAERGFRKEGEGAEKEGQAHFPISDETVDVKERRWCRRRWIAKHYVLTIYCLVMKSSVSRFKKITRKQFFFPLQLNCGTPSFWILGRPKLKRSEKRRGRINERQLNRELLMQRSGSGASPKLPAATCILPYACFVSHTFSQGSS